MNDKTYLPELLKFVHTQRVLVAPSRLSLNPTGFLLTTAGAMPSLPVNDEEKEGEEA